jgi:phage FluMu protein Com
MNKNQKEPRNSNPLDVMVKCPHCDGTDGYYSKSLIRHTQMVTWGGDAFECIMDRVSGGEQKRCLECNKIIKGI